MRKRLRPPTRLLAACAPHHLRLVLPAALSTAAGEGDLLATNLAGQFLTMAIDDLGSTDQNFTNGTGRLGSI